jgi:trk system potassium uptake protein TrkH
VTDLCRYAAYLRSRYQNVLGYCGLLWALIGGLIATPATLVILFPAEQDTALRFLAAGLPLILVSLGIWIKFRPRSASSLTLNEASVIVVLSWLVAILAGAVPFLMLNLTWVQAIFESTSGWTTTGLSIIDTGTASPLLLFYRSLMQLTGGAGLAILMLSAITGPAGSSLNSAEGRAEQLVPHVKRSAQLVVILYGAYVVFGVLALRLAGMRWFDAINHAFCALSTGGFSTRPDSIGAWHSVSVDIVTTILMLLGMMSFLTGYALWRGQLKKALHNSEIRLLIWLLPLAVTCLFIGSTLQLDGGFDGRFRLAMFQAISALSTTGFSSIDLRELNEFGWLLITILMLIGGGAGSTAGGIKLYRVYALSQGLFWNLRQQFLPVGAINRPVVWVGEERRFLNDQQLRRIGIYVFLYLAVWLVGSCVLVAFGHGMSESLFEFASTLGTVGLSVGVTSIDASAGQLLLQSWGMIFGRLEFFVVVTGILTLGRDLPLMARTPSNKGEHGNDEKK